MFFTEYFHSFYSRSEQLAQAYLWNVYLVPAASPLEEEWIFHGLFTIRVGMYKNCQIPFRIHLPLLLYPPTNNFQLPLYFTTDPPPPHPCIYSTTGFFNLAPFIQHLYSQTHGNPPNLLIYCLHFVRNILESQSFEQFVDNYYPFCEVLHDKQFREWNRDGAISQYEIARWKANNSKQVSLESLFSNEWFHPSKEEFNKAKHWDIQTLRQFMKKLDLP